MQTSLFGQFFNEFPDFFVGFLLLLLFVVAVVVFMLLLFIYVVIH